jgi:hypothetical protein
MALRSVHVQQEKSHGLIWLQKTLKFINGDATSVHGCVRASSIFTGESGEWKLAGFEVLSSLKEDDPVIYVCVDITAPEAMSNTCRHMVLSCQTRPDMLPLKLSGLDGKQSRVTQSRLPMPTISVFSSMKSSTAATPAPTSSASLNQFPLPCNRATNA